MYHYLKIPLPTLEAIERSDISKALTKRTLSLLSSGRLTIQKRVLSTSATAPDVLGHGLLQLALQVDLLPGSLPGPAAPPPPEEDEAAEGCRPPPPPMLTAPLKFCEKRGDISKLLADPASINT